jgi:hypothetical protein
VANDGRGGGGAGQRRDEGKSSPCPWLQPAYIPSGHEASMTCSGRTHPPCSCWNGAQSYHFPDDQVYVWILWLEH